MLVHDDEEFLNAPADLYFNKMNHVGLDVYRYVRDGCVGTPFFFDTPPPPYRSDGSARSLRDVLCIEHLQIMNAALCDFYRLRCHRPHAAEGAEDEEGIDGGESGGGETAAICPVAHETITEVLHGCRDQHAKCATFAQDNECWRNPLWMLAWCPKSCQSCSTASRQRIRRRLGVRLTAAYDRIGPLAAQLEPAAEVVAEVVP